MKKLLLILISLTGIQIGHSENFKTLQGNNEITFQIDLDSIKKQGQYHHVVVAQKFNSIQNDARIKYNEMRSDFILDCASNSEYTSRLSRYQNNILVWEMANPKSFKLEKDDSGMIEYICKNEITS